MPPTTDSERAPLLSSTDAGGHDVYASTAAEVETPSQALPPAARPFRPRERAAILGLNFSLLIALAIGGSLINTPITELQENNICRRIHGPDPEPGACKGKEVQSELSFIRGWDTTFSTLPSLVASVPYGALADRFGRTLVLGLSLLGITLNVVFNALVCAVPGVFPPRAIWLGSLFQLIGGGETVFDAMVYSIVADITHEAERSTAFFYLGASLMGGGLVASPIVYLAMKRGPWFTIEAGLICLSIATIIAFLVPETVDKTAAAVASGVTAHYDETTPSEPTDPALLSSPPPGANNDISTSTPSLEQEQTSNPDRPLTAALAHTLTTLHFLFLDHKLVGLLLLSLALEILGRTTVLLLLQYAAKRYRIPYSEAALLDSVVALASLVLLLVILPGASQVLLVRMGLSPREKDLRLAQASAVVAAAGVMVMGLAGTRAVLVVGVVIMALGGGYTFMIRGLMTSLVGGHEIGLMYTSIAFVETFSTLVSGPVWAGLFNVGLGWGDEWAGLPFVVGGWMLVAAAVLVGVIRGSMVAEEVKVDEALSEDAEVGM